MTYKFLLVDCFSYIPIDMAENFYIFFKDQCLNNASRLVIDQAHLLHVNDNRQVAVL